MLSRDDPGVYTQKFIDQVTSVDIVDDLLMNFESEIVQPAAHIGKKQRSSRNNIVHRIAVARDEAFCFYYQQNLEILEQAGLAVVPFSPLHDEGVPSSCRMVYLGGGYPELYADKLASNRSMLHSLKQLHEKNITIYGECGGFMYLCSHLVDLQGKSHRMTGIFPFTVRMNDRLRKLGYRRVELLALSPLGEKGDHLYGHEFHYSHLENKEQVEIDDHLRYLYKLDNNSYEGYHCGSAIGSYIHLHFGKVKEITEHFKRSITQNIGAS